jgi:hypothetical protein
MSATAILSLVAGLALASASVAAATTPPLTRADELRGAQAELGALRQRYDERHPRLIEAQARLKAWQRLDLEEHSEPLILQRAWVESDVLRQRYQENHPKLLAQQARVAAMEQEWRSSPDSPEELLAVVGDLAAMGTRLGEENPKYQDQVRKVAAWRHHLLGPSRESGELRRARAMQEYLRGRYDVNHPKMREIAGQITELEK